MARSCKNRDKEESMSKSLNELRDEVVRIAMGYKGYRHGLGQDATVPEDIALMHLELSEALEEFHEGYLPNQTKYRGYKPVGIPTKMADLIIRVLRFCGKYEIDIERAVEEKIAYSEGRPYTRHLW
jgi:NTP pyrophosphatase (non-canonical NTP hydrolase)